jgi:hypothetical protein
MSLQEQLAAPFPPDRVSWRPGSMTKDKSKARALAYIDARDVMQRLDDVCGLGGWQCRYSHVAPIIVCDIAIKIDGEWLWKANGAGQTDIEGEKGGSSDAFKRAAVMLGIGRYLYDIDSPWVQVNEWKQIVDSEMPRLRALLPSPAGSTPRPAQQTKAQFRETFAALGVKMRQCPSDPALDEFLAANAETLEKMPADWRAHWIQAVDAHRQALMQRRAA